MQATVKFVYGDGAEEIEVGDHRIQFGFGTGGDGFCYTHQSFECIDHLTDGEKEALKTPDYDI